MPHPLARAFGASPWQQITALQIAPVAQAPTMLSNEERQLYYWLAENARGLGASVELGTFAGGSTAHLALGLSRSGHAFHLHGYDRFTASAGARAKHLSPGGRPLTDQENILPLARSILSPWADNITLHAGEIADVVWRGGPIELLVIDAAKSTVLADHIAAQFFPSMIAGQSLLVHQDFLHAQQPWLAMQMLRLSEYFTPLGQVARDCVVFACTKVPDADALAQARTDMMGDDKMMSAIRAAAKLYEFIPKERFKAMIAKLRANPGVRVAWQMSKD